MSARRDNAGKPELAEVLRFGPALEFLAVHMAAGRAKYPDTEPGVPNWTLGGKPDFEYLNAAARHLAKLVGGEEYDGELGTHHAAAAMWNLAAFLTLNRRDAPRRVSEPLGWRELPVEEWPSLAEGELVRVAWIGSGWADAEERTVRQVHPRSSGIHRVEMEFEPSARWSVATPADGDRIQVRADRR